MKPFKAKCPNCGKEVLTYDVRKLNYCGIMCKTNAAFKRRYLPGKGPR